jgi:hypothetical protein
MLASILMTILKLAVQIFKNISEFCYSFVIVFLPIHIVSKAGLDHVAVELDQILDSSDILLEKHVVRWQVHGGCYLDRN